MSKKPKVIVTGASGFIGKSFLRRMNWDAFDITVLTRDVSKSFLHSDKIKIVQGDLTQLSSLMNAFQGQDILVNLAAEVRNEAKLEETNVQGTKNLLEAIEKTGIRKVIHLSSVGVLGVGYQSKATLVDENYPATPDNSYEKTKKISEDLFLTAAKEQDFSLTVLRPTNVFGPEHPFQALLNLCQHAQANKPLLWSKGAQVNYVFVEDLTQTIFHFLQEKNQTGVYHVGNSLELKTFYELLKKSLKSESKMVRIPDIFNTLLMSLRIGKLKAVSNRVAYSDAKLANEFSYPKGIEKGLEEVILYYQEKKLLK